MIYNFYIAPVANQFQQRSSFTSPRCMLLNLTLELAIKNETSAIRLRELHVTISIAPRRSNETNEITKYTVHHEFVTPWQFSINYSMKLSYIYTYTQKTSTITKRCKV